MKKLLLIFFLIGCSEKKHDYVKDLVIVLSLQNQCQNYFNSNPLFSSAYYNRYAIDYNQYDKLILGDSTMDIACGTFPGYYTNGTGCFPVSGNTLYDMRQQLCVLNSRNPSFILVSTSGGNDLLRSKEISEIISDGKKLMDEINLKYPSARKTLILVHPTRVDIANTNRKITNVEIETYGKSKDWKIVNPDSCFTIESDGKASQSNLLDSIHPNIETAMCIKGLVGEPY